MQNEFHYRKRLLDKNMSGREFCTIKHDDMIFKMASSADFWIFVFIFIFRFGYVYFFRITENLLQKDFVYMVFDRIRYPMYKSRRKTGVSVPFKKSNLRNNQLSPKMYQNVYKYVYFMVKVHLEQDRELDSSFLSKNFTRKTVISIIFLDVCFSAVK